MLSFTAEVLSSLFAQYNKAVWPAHLVAGASVVVAVWLAVRPVPKASRVIGMLLAAACLWIAIVFHWHFFAPINFMAPLYAIVFGGQALLLLWRLVLRSDTRFQFRPDFFGWCGLLLTGLAIIGVPLLSVLVGEGWQSTRLVGLTASPTAVFILGLLLLVDGRAPLSLAIIPLLWTLLAGVTAWFLTVPEDLALPLLGPAAAILILMKNGRVRRFQEGLGRV